MDKHNLERMPGGIIHGPSATEISSSSFAILCGGGYGNNVIIDTGVLGGDPKAWYGTCKILKLFTAAAGSNS